MFYEGAMYEIKGGIVVIEKIMFDIFSGHIIMFRREDSGGEVIEKGELTTSEFVNFVRKNRPYWQELS